MNKVKYYILVYILSIVLVFFIPSIFVKGGIYVENEFNNVDKEEKDSKFSDFIETTNIKVLKNETNEVVQMGLEEYIKGVVCAEMPASYELEALKAQAVAARTYTINKMIANRENNKNEHPQVDVCDDFAHCQSYVEPNDKVEQWRNAGENADNLLDKIEEAVISTSGEIITYNSQPIKAFFHANSGGMTEDVELVWGGNEIPYLKSVETLGENNYKQYSSTVNITKEELIKKMKEKYSNFEIDYTKNNCICIEEVSNSGRVQKIKFGNIVISGIDARMMFGLKSTMFTFLIKDDHIEFNVLGYGHGVGMSQTGANQLAINGYTYKDILYHYYLGVEITNME